MSSLSAPSSFSLLRLRSLTQMSVKTAQMPLDLRPGFLGRSPVGQRLGAWAALCFSAALALPAGASSFDAATVRDSRASFLDVPARTAFLKQGTDDPYLAASLPEATDCSLAPSVVPPQGPMVIPPRYATGNHGPLHPDYEATVKLYRDFEASAALFANQYVATGDPRFSTCLLNHLDLWAKANALLDYTVSTEKGASNQAWYQSEWSVSAAALALSQVVREPTLDAPKLQSVIDWLHRVSRKQMSYPGGENTCCNNHAYWRGVHATMVGVLAKDDDLFRWGLGRYTLAIDQIAADGSWPLETARHEQALHYQNYALLPVVTIAEIAAQQGLDLYAYSANGRDLHSAVGYLVPALEAARAATPEGEKPKLDLRAFAPGRGDQAWAEFYRARFGNDPLGLLSKPVNSPRNGGNATLLVYKPAALKAK